MDCRLLDFQVLSLGSPALDLNHLLYPSLSSTLRKAELPNILTDYYANFASVLATTNTTMKFTLMQLKNEFHSKLTFGFLFAVMMVPAVLIDSKDAPKFEEFIGGDGMEEAAKIFRVKLNKLTLASPSLRPRLLDMFDEVKETNLFKSSNVSQLVRSYSQKEFTNK